MCSVYQTDDHLREEAFDPRSHSRTYVSLFWTHSYHKYNCLSRVSWCIIKKKKKKNEVSVQPLLGSFFSLYAFVLTPFTPLIHPHPPLFIYLKGQAPVIVQNKHKKCENDAQLTVSLIFTHLLTTFFLGPCCLTPRCAQRFKQWIKWMANLCSVILHNLRPGNQTVGGFLDGHCIRDPSTG